MHPTDQFLSDVDDNIKLLGDNSALKKKSLEWMISASAEGSYSYNFQWLGRPIIQFPQDIVAVQELIWKLKPDLIIETGIAHGGSLILSASILALLDMADAIKERRHFDPLASSRKVLGVDIDIREHNREAIKAHPMASRIQMIEGSSISEDVIEQVHTEANNFQNILIFLDSNHTHDHVLAELLAYGPLVSKGGYCVVFDTVVEDVPGSMFPNRPWGPGNNPKTAVWEFLKLHPEFKIDKSIEDKLQITVAPDGFLLRK